MKPRQFVKIPLQTPTMPLAPLADPWQKVDVQADPDVSVMSVIRRPSRRRNFSLGRVDPHNKVNKFAKRRHSDCLVMIPSHANALTANT